MLSFASVIVRVVSKLYPVVEWMEQHWHYKSAKYIQSLNEKDSLYV